MGGSDTGYSNRGVRWYQSWDGGGKQSDVHVIIEKEKVQQREVQETKEGVGRRKRRKRRREKGESHP